MRPRSGSLTSRWIQRISVVIAGLAALAAGPRPATAEAQVWTEVGVRYDVDKRLTLGVDLHTRFDEDVSRLGSVMPELGLSYRVKKWLRLGAGYRFEYERDKDGILVSRHRGFGWGRVRRDLGDVRLEYRLQLQEQHRADANPVNRHTVRNRGDVSLRRFGAVVPGASVEFHHILGEDNNTIHLGKVWLSAGVEYERGDISVEVFYRAIVGQYDPADPTGHVLGVGLHYQL